MQASGTAPHLFQEKVFTHYQLEEAEACSTESHKAQYILDHLLNRGSEHDYQVFVQVLLTTDQRHLAHLLQPQLAHSG